MRTRAVVTLERLSGRKIDAHDKGGHSRRTKGGFMKQLSDPVQRLLNMYTLAAGAAGVSVLALAEPCEARIVYKPTNITIGWHGKQMYKLDFNADGIGDVVFQYFRRSFYCDGSRELSFRIDETAPKRNGVVGHAAPLSAGAVIGASQKFYGGQHYMQQQVLGGRPPLCGPGSSRGPWRNTDDRYLGVEFRIRGRRHFGWARLSVHRVFGPGLQAHLTGYAYETIPGKSIIAGKTHRSADEWDKEDLGPEALLADPAPHVPQAASLAILALGAQGVPLWRRKESDLVEYGVPAVKN